MSVKSVGVVAKTEIVTNRVGNTVRHYIIYTMEDGTYLMGALPDVQEIDAKKREYWLDL